MHTHKQTLLSKMGFSDADSKDPEHELACAWLTLDKNARSVFVEMANMQPKFLRPTWDCSTESEFIRRTIWRCDGCCIGRLSKENIADIERNGSINKISMRANDKASVESEAVQEFYLTKGQDQYRQTIGFIDVLVTLKTVRRFVNFDVAMTDEDKAKATNEYRCPCGHVTCLLKKGYEEKEDRMAQDSLSFIVEVKSSRQSASETIKQLNLYKSYMPNSAAVLFPLYELSGLDRKLIEAARIHVLDTKEQFFAWKKEQGL